MSILDAMTRCGRKPRTAGHVPAGDFVRHGIG